MGTFTTSVMWHDSRGGEIETDLRVTYSFYAGYNGDWENPPEPASVEITKLIAGEGSLTVPDHFYTSVELEQECFEDHAAMLADVEERRAEQRRDDDMMETL